MQDLGDQIEAAYLASGNRLGWRLLYSPARVLSGAELAFIGLNPGGRAADPAHDGLAITGGSAFRCESWAGHPPGQSPLQQQVLGLFSALEQRPEAVLAGNLVPFRSPDWAGLRGRRAAVTFGAALWRQCLARAQPRLIVTMGNPAFGHIHRIIAAGPIETVPLGWGKVCGRRARGYDGPVLVGLPHLSRYRVVTRPQSALGLDRLFRGWARFGIQI